jgi:hypothetical protein
MIYIGTDEGIYRWYEGTPWPIFHSLQDRGVLSIAAPGAGFLAVVDSGGRVLESVNNGIDWRTIPPPGGSARAVAVAMGGAPGSIVLTTRPMGLSHRVVGAPVPRPESRRAPAFLRGLLDFTGGGTEVATREPKRHAGSEGSSGWTALGVPSVPDRPGIVPRIRTLAIAPGETETWFAAVSGAGLWRSADGGLSWIVCEGLPDEVYAILVVPKKPGMVALATSDGCRISLDGGQTWEDRSGGLDGARHVRALEVHPDDPNALLAGAAPGGPTEGTPAKRGVTQDSLYESSDGGKTWKQVRRGFPDVLESDTISDIRVDPAAPDNAIVALASGELWRTRNGGDWWEPLARQIRAARVLCAAI